jgi:hypothetical protein
VDDLAGLDELIGNRPGRCNGDREANPLCYDPAPPGRRPVCIDTDYLALQVYQRPPEFPGLMGASVWSTSNRNGPAADWR